MLGLPDGVTACLFDLDGVLTQTAKVHSKAWKQMFDEYLKERAEKEGAEYVAFDSGADYNSFVDGKPRYDGVRDFLASRGIELPEDEIHALGDRKNDLVLAIIKKDGVEAYPGSVDYLKAASEAGLRRAVVSSSTNCADVVRAAGIDGYLEVRVDGVVAQEEGLKGKPAPDTFLAAATKLGVEPAAAAVFEDALAGVEAGHAGKFGCVVGVDRVDHGKALSEHGADLVVEDLSELLERP
jgi:beta-phosphoglucomutase family hydrolase